MFSKPKTFQLKILFLKRACMCITPVQTQRTTFIILYVINKPSDQKLMAGITISKPKIELNCIRKKNIFILT